MSALLGRRVDPLRSAPLSLLFRGVRKGTPQSVLVTLDLFGFHSFQFDRARGKYTPEHEDSLWHIRLRDCRTRERFDNIPLPGGFGARDYEALGLDSLGYLAAVASRPELAEYVDNPGILVLLIARPDRARALLANRMDRVSLVRALTGSDLIRSFHINWLKKVRPGADQPRVVADSLEASLLRVPACDRMSGENRHPLRLFKLFAHQQQWTVKGMNFARALMQREDLEIDDFSYLMDTFNGNEPEVISSVRTLLLDVGNAKDYMSMIARSRARYIARHEQMLSLQLASRLRNCLSETGEERDSVDTYARFLTDDDIPAPVVGGNDQVRALDTLKKLRGHATRAKNCVWSIGIISGIMMRHIDLYAIDGKHQYTMSVDRRSLEIQTLEPFKYGRTHPADLRLIADWFEAATALPR